MILAVVVIGMSLLIWLHPRLGYAQDGIIKDADLRASLVQILWICFSVFSLSSSIVLKESTRFSLRWSIWVIAYSLGIMTNRKSHPYFVNSQ